MTATIVQSRNELEQRRDEVRRQITAVSNQRDRAAAQRKDTTEFTDQLKALWSEADELDAALRGARLLEGEVRDQEKLADRQKAFELARYALADVAACATEIQEAAERLAARVTKLRAAESSARHAAAEVGVSAVNFPAILTEHELVQLLETIPTRGEVWPDRSISDRVQSRAGKAFQLLRAEMPE